MMEALRYTFSFAPLKSVLCCLIGKTYEVSTAMTFCFIFHLLYRMKGMMSRFLRTDSARVSGFSRSFLVKQQRKLTRFSEHGVRKMAMEGCADDFRSMAYGWKKLASGLRVQQLLAHVGVPCTCHPSFQDTFWSSELSNVMSAIDTSLFHTSPLLKLLMVWGVSFALAELRAGGTPLCSDVALSRMVIWAEGDYLPILHFFTLTEEQRTERKNCTISEVPFHVELLHGITPQELRLLLIYTVYLLGLTLSISNPEGGQCIFEDLSGVARSAASGLDEAGRRPILEVLEQLKCWSVPSAEKGWVSYPLTRKIECYLSNPSAFYKNTTSSSQTLASPLSTSGEELHVVQQMNFQLSRIALANSFK